MAFLDSLLFGIRKIFRDGAEQAVASGLDFEGNGWTLTSAFDATGLRKYRIRFDPTYALGVEYNIVSGYGAVAGNGTTPVATANTAALQAAINAANAAGGGRVVIPAGDFYFQHGLLDVNVVAQLNNVSNVEIVGFGRNVTRLHLINNADASFFNCTGSTSRVAIRHMALDGNRANQTPSIVHGIRTDSVSGLYLEDLYIHDISHYGIGVEGYVQEYLFFSNIEIRNTGGDGFDQKNKADANVFQIAHNITVTNFGLNTLEPTQTGWDCRGAWQLSNIVIHFTANDGSGIRMRNGESGADPALGGFGGHRSHVSNFEIYGPGTATLALGLEVVARDVHISNGYIRDVFYGAAPTGLDATSDSKRSTISNVTVENFGSAAFITSANTGAFAFINCRAITGPTGFRARCAGTEFINCHAYGCTTAGISTDTAGTFCKIVNPTIVGVGGASMVGMDLAAADAEISGGDVSACWRNASTSALRTKLIGTRLRTAIESGIVVAVGGDDCQLISVDAMSNGSRGVHTRAARTKVIGGSITGNSTGFLTETSASEALVSKSTRFSGNTADYDDSGTNTEFERRLIVSSLNEAVAASGTSANIDTALEASTTYLFLVEASMEDNAGSPARATIAANFLALRSGSGAPIVSAGTTEFSTGTGLTLNVSASSNNLRVSVTKSAGTNSRIDTRIWLVRRCKTVEFS